MRAVTASRGKQGANKRQTYGKQAGKGRASMRIDVPMRWLGAMLVSLLLAAPLRAQEVSLAPSLAQGCLILLPGGPDRPEYPESALKRKDGATVSVELQFDSPHYIPSVRWLDDNYGSSFKEAVSAHVARYRVPCIPEQGGKALLRQTFVFDPSDGRKVMASVPQDPVDAQRNEVLGCLGHTKGKLLPDYGMSALRDGEQGKYWVSLDFQAPDQAPQVRWLAESPSWRLKEAVAEHVKELRLPCMTASPVRVEQLFNFRIEEGARTRIKDMDLQKFLGAAQNLPLPALFDTRNMACPFDLRVRYYQPHGLNQVGELEQSNPVRQPFLDWLAQVKLKVDAATSLLLLGEQFTLSVPCVRVDL